jgi:hypothetical protein
MILEDKPLISDVVLSQVQIIPTVKMQIFSLVVYLGTLNLHKIGNTQKLFKSNVIKL